MILIGISGVTCSGKSTLSRNLREHYGDFIETLSFDDYFIGSDIKDVDEIEDFETPDFYNFSGLLNDLRKLKKGEQVTLRTNSLESVKAGVKSKKLESKKVLIVEGWLIFHDPRIAELFDAKIYIDVSEEAITSRRYGRTQGSKHWDSHEYIKDKIIPAFHKYVEPQAEIADLVLNGDSSEKEIMDKAVNFIDEYIKRIG